MARRHNPQVRIDPVIIDALRRLADRRGQTMAALLRDVLAAYLLAAPDCD